jgi:hypothetical protein
MASSAYGCTEPFLAEAAGDGPAQATALTTYSYRLEHRKQAAFCP